MVICQVSDASGMLWNDASKDSDQVILNIKVMITERRQGAPGELA
jgi:hypothetical protein